MVMVIELVKILQERGQGGFHVLNKGQGDRYSIDSDSSKTERTIQCYMGPIPAQTLQSLSVETGRSLSGLVDDQEKQGSLLNVGGHPYSVDWSFDSNTESKVQYLCVSASLEEKPQTMFGDKIGSSRIPARVQVWSVTETFEANLDLVLCFDQGYISSVRWVPIVEDVGDSTVGLLSACMQDGSVGIYAVPRPHVIPRRGSGPLYLKLDPLVQLDVRKGVPSCMEWFDADKVAVAYSDGWLSVWSLSSCLQAGSRHARPQVFSKISSSLISSLAWHSDGRQVFASSFDGSARCISLAQPHLSSTLYHSRDVSYAIGYSQALGLPLMERPELDDIRTIDMIDDRIHSKTVYSHLGRIRTISLSPRHSFIASGAVDGTLRVVNLAAVHRPKGNKTPKYNDNQPIYRLDYNRGKGELRMIENLAPLPLTYSTKHAMASTAAWDPAISITAARWNPNRRKKFWLLSAVACGFVRIDVFEDS